MRILDAIQRHVDDAEHAGTTDDAEDSARVAAKLAGVAERLHAIGAWCPACDGEPVCAAGPFAAADLDDEAWGDDDTEDEDLDDFVGFCVTVDPDGNVHTSIDGLCEEHADLLAEDLFDIAAAHFGGFDDRD